MLRTIKDYVQKDNDTKNLGIELLLVKPYVQDQSNNDIANLNCIHESTPSNV